MTSFLEYLIYLYSSSVWKSPRLQFMDLLQFLHHSLSSVVRIMIKEIPMQDKVFTVCVLKEEQEEGEGEVFFTDLSLII